MSPALILALTQLGIGLFEGISQWKASVAEAKRAGLLTEEQAAKLVADVKARAAKSDAAWDALAASLKE